MPRAAETPHGRDVWLDAETGRYLEPVGWPDAAPFAATAPTYDRPRRRWWVPLLVAVVVLSLFAAAGYGLAYVTAQLTAAPRPRSTPPPAAVAATPSPTPGDEATPQPSRRSPRPTATPAATPSPGPTPRIHVVKRGEWLDLIARRYGVPLRSIVDANGITDPNRIEAGQRLVIPER